MEALGSTLAGVCPRGARLFFQGTLGAGKTTLIRGFLRALGHRGVVKSPTYTLIEPYHLNGVDIFHFDLYRLGEPAELEALGVRDYFSEDGICLVEWPEHGGERLGQADLLVNITYQNDHRHVTLAAHTPKGNQLLAREIFSL